MQAFLGQHHHHELAVLDADLQAEAAGAHAVERRVGPGSAAVARDQNAAAPLAAEKETDLEDARAHHHRAGLAQLALLVLRIGGADDFLHREGGAVDKGLLLGLGHSRAGQHEQGGGGEGLDGGAADARHVGSPG